MTDPLPPSRFREDDMIADRFRLRRPLAEGAHGEVWEAVDTVTRRAVAVKLPTVRSRTGGRSPLEDEARAAERVGHWNVVPVYFSGRDGDTPYLVLRLIDGETLEERLEHARERNTPLAVAEAVRIAREIAVALVHVHGRRFVHRDLKPANVLLDAAGRVYLADFGIALATDAAGRGAAACTGSLAYMAPEQLTPAAPLDGRADIYALGIILFRMLTGQLPFREWDLTRRTPPPVRGINGSVPQPLAAMVEACLAPDPADRHVSASALLAALGGDPSTSELMPVEVLRQAPVEVRLRYLESVTNRAPLPPGYVEPAIELLVSSCDTDLQRVERILLKAGGAVIPALLTALRQEAAAETESRSAILALVLRIAPGSPSVREAIADLGLGRAALWLMRATREPRHARSRSRGRRAALVVGAAAVVGLAVWLAAQGIDVGVCRSLETVRPLRAVMGLVAGCLAIGLIATRRRMSFALLLLACLGVVGSGIPTACENALFATADAVNRALRPSSP